MAPAWWLRFQDEVSPQENPFDGKLAPRRIGPIMHYLWGIYQEYFDKLNQDVGRTPCVAWTKVERAITEMKGIQKDVKTSRRGFSS